MSPEEAIQRAIPELQVEIDPGTPIPAPMDARSFASKFKECKLLSREEGQVIVSRRFIRRGPDSYRPLTLPQDVEAAVIDLGRAWEHAAQAFPRNRTLYQLLTDDEPGVRAALNRIEEAYAGVRRAAAGHGVPMPEPWGYIDEAKLELAETRGTRRAGR